ncbi:MAG: hypothetical protein IKH57_12810 [Clostridia bacterium]|nr:hypothetical protein [Clostridia bacterium]
MEFFLVLKCRHQWGKSRIQIGENKEKTSSARNKKCCSEKQKMSETPLVFSRFSEYNQFWRKKMNKPENK